MITLGSNNIGSIFLGSVPIGKAYLGSNLVYQKGGSPTPVSMIPYIRGGADGSYIDTGIVPDSTTKVIVWARNWNPGSDTLFGVGSGSTGATNCYFISQPATTNTGKIHLFYGTVGSPWASTSDFIYSSNYHKYELYAGTLKVDDETRATGSTTATISTQYSIHIFGKGDGSGGHTNMTLPVDICAVKIYKGGALVRDFTPVESPSVGLYDSVSSTLFTNSGSGSFTYGSFDKNAYDPQQYIVCSGGQYFDSGEYGQYSGGIVSKFMPTNTTAAWTALLGYRDTSNSCDISFGTATSGEDNMRCYWRFGPNNTSTAAFNGNTSNKLTNKAIVAVKVGQTLTLYNNATQIGSAAKSGVSSSFQTENTLCVGALKQPSAISSYFTGRLYYVRINLKNFVPAKVGSVYGMYDTYGDVFYQSATSNPFVAGA